MTVLLYNMCFVRHMGCLHIEDLCRGRQKSEGLMNALM